MPYFQSRPGEGISLCMIVRDEEKLLPRLLDTVVPWVDELVVVDTGSMDRTKEIVLDYGGHLFETELRSFATARNLYLDKALGDWIFMLDADEMPNEDLLNHIHIWTHYAYSVEYLIGLMITRENLLDGQPTTAGRHLESHLRLFRNGFFRYVGHLHEMPIILPGQKNVVVETAPRHCRILHHKTRERQAKQDNFYKEFATMLGDERLMELQGVI